MSLLDALAGGLRGAAGVLSPVIQQQTMQQDQQREMLMEQRKNAVAQQLIKAAEMGAIQPEVAKARLQSLGFGDVPVGPGIDAQQRRAAMEKEAAYRKALSELGPNPSQEQLTQVAGQFSGPDKTLDVLQRSQDRQMQAESRREETQQRLQQAAQQFQDRMEQTRQAQEARLQMARESNASREQIAQMQIEGRQQLQTMMLEGRRQLGALAGALRQPPAPHITTNDQGVFAIDRSGVAKQVVDDKGVPLSGKASEKAMPASAVKGLFENQVNLTRAQTALDLIQGKDVGEMKGDKKATGIKGFLPDQVLQRVDTQGIDARAALADLGSLVIHDRSGAAVTAKEFPRLQPFIPSSKDDPATVEKKLKRFVQVYKQEADLTRDYYKDSGFKVPAVGSATPKAADGGWSIKEKP